MAIRLNGSQNSAGESTPNQAQPLPTAQPPQVHREAMPVHRETGRKKEAVNHPEHYGGKDNTYEVIKVIRAWDIGFSLGNTLKYIARAGRKDPAKRIEDLHKAMWYLQEEINNEYQKTIDKSEEKVK